MVYYCVREWYSVLQLLNELKMILQLFYCLK